jgi:hypothetical protein
MSCAFGALDSVRAPGIYGYGMAGIVYLPACI